MDLGLKDKVVLVSGASRGIGKGIALGFAREHCRLAIVARGKADLEALVPELTAAGAAEVCAITADVTTAQGATDAVEGTVAALGGIDIVIANVGKSKARHARDMDDEDLAFSLDMNLWSSARVCQRAAPHIRSRGGGVMTLISSVWGREGGGAPGYNIAKAGVISMAKALAHDYAADNIRVNSVAPGSILFPGGGWDRRMQSDPDGINAFIKQELPFGRFGTVDEVADVVVFVSSARASWISGTTVTVDGCQTRVF